MRAARHLSQDHGGVAGDVLPHMAGKNLRGDRQAADRARADHDGDGLAFEEIGLGLRGRLQRRGKQEAKDAIMRR